MCFLLLILWIVFNGKFTIEILWIGALVCAGIYLFCIKFLNFSVKREIKLLKKTPLVILYLLVLLKEIFFANIVALKFVLMSKKVKPILYTFSVDLKSNGAKVALSHSITLTPGTITVELVDNVFIVHCLDESMAEGMENSEFIRLLKKIEK